MMTGGLTAMSWAIRVVRGSTALRRRWLQASPARRMRAPHRRAARARTHPLLLLGSLTLLLG